MVGHLNIPFRDPAEDTKFWAEDVLEPSEMQTRVKRQRNSTKRRVK